MITNDSNLKRNDFNTKISEHISSVKPVKTFYLRSQIPLQFVITKTFINMLNAITKTFKIEDESQTSLEKDDYEMFEVEEDILIEKFHSQFNKQDDKTLYKAIEDYDGAEEDDEVYAENPSFNILFKNELGLDVSLQAISGFKFQNIDLVNANSSSIKRELTIDKVDLKNDSSCPITVQNSLNYAFTYKSNSLLESEKEKNSMKFKLDVIIFI